MSSRPIVRLTVVVILASAVVMAAAAAGPNRDGPATEPTAHARLFEGIPQHRISLGSVHAQFVLTEFADLQCPFCAAYAREVLPTVVDRYVRTGKVRLELQVLAFLGEDSVRGAAMAAASARQDRMWQFVDAFYRSQGPENSGYATDDFLRRVGAAAPGLDVEQAFAEHRMPRVLRTLDEAARAGRVLGVDHTPAFYLRRRGGPSRSLEPSALSAEAFTAALDAAIAGR